MQLVYLNCYFQCRLFPNIFFCSFFWCDIIASPAQFCCVFGILYFKCPGQVCWQSSSAQGFGGFYSLRSCNLWKSISASWSLARWLVVRLHSTGELEIVLFLLNFLKALVGQGLRNSSPELSGDLRSVKLPVFHQGDELFTNL